MDYSINLSYIIRYYLINSSFNPQFSLKPLEVRLNITLAYQN